MTPFTERWRVAWDPDGLEFDDIDAVYDRADELAKRFEEDQDIRVFGTNDDGEPYDDFVRVVAYE